MRFIAYIFIIANILSVALPGHATVVDRKTPFLKFKREKAEIDSERMAGKNKWYNNREEYEEQRAKDRAEYSKKRRKTATVSDDFGPEIREWRNKRRREFDEYEEVRQRYSKGIVRQSQSNLSEMEEFDLAETRERADYRKRVLYGGKPSYGKNIVPGEGGSGSGSPGGGYVPRPSDYTPYTPPPSGGDADYQSGDDFLPPPPPPEGFENDIPPPPPFIPEDGGDGFIPPPPPPPFEDEPPPPVY